MLQVKSSLLHCYSATLIGYSIASARLECFWYPQAGVFLVSPGWSVFGIATCKLWGSSALQGLLSHSAATRGCFPYIGYLIVDARLERQAAGLECLTARLERQAAGLGRLWSSEQFCMPRVLMCAYLELPRGGTCLQSVGYPIVWRHACRLLCPQGCSSMAGLLCISAMSAWLGRGCTLCGVPSHTQGGGTMSI